LKKDLGEVLRLLEEDKPLPEKYRAPPLVNKDARECHVKPDLLLVYRKRGRGRGAAIHSIFPRMALPSGYPASALSSGETFGSPE
jgi:addiction module RelE/StbE family toxin